MLCSGILLRLRSHGVLLKLAWSILLLRDLGLLRRRLDRRLGLLLGWFLGRCFSGLREALLRLLRLLLSLLAVESRRWLASVSGMRMHRRRRIENGFRGSWDDPLGGLGFNSVGNLDCMLRN